VANSAVPTLLVLGGLALAVIVLFGSTLVSFGTNILSEINAGISSFFKQLGLSTGITPSPTPSPGGGSSPTPTPIGSTPTPTPGSSTYHVTFTVNAPTSNPLSESCTIIWTDTSTGSNGAVNLLTNPSGSTSPLPFKAGDILSIMATYSGTGCHLDHYTVSPGGSTNNNPFSLTVTGDATVTAYFMAN